MAQRVSDYRVRRFADRGNEEDGPDSRARGDRFYRNRRSADRGNEKVNRDPGNIYNFPPVYDEYEDEDWYYWMTGSGAGVTYDPNTLPVIYDRGLLGVMHDWCEPFDTYPRTYDLSHAAGLFLVEKKRCNLLSIMLEMDIILRPRGHVYIRNSILVIDELQEIGRITGLILLVENGDRVVNDYVFDPGGSFFAVIKTRGRVFFEEGENDADKDMKNSKFSHIR